MDDYRQLKKHFHETGYLHRAISLLDWDHETYLPAKGVPFRADQQAFLSRLAHERLTSNRVADLIASCESNSTAMNATQQANIRAWRRDRDRAVKLPTDFVEHFEKTCALGKAAWTEARRTSQFELFASHLEQLVELSRKKADYYGYKEHPYDALMDEYEPGCTNRILTPIFEQLKQSIVSWLPYGIEKTNQIPSNLLESNYPIQDQAKFNTMVARAMGFDFQSGRIDTTTHPFCTDLGPHDVRLTTRYELKDFAVSLYSVLHEAGHGLYEQGFCPEHAGTPMAEAVSLGIHESQSRLWENKVGRAPEFWSEWYGKACQCLPSLKPFSPEEITMAVNRVSPSFIRVEADEVTYDLHIILRFELEKLLISGDLPVKDVPKVWNARFKEMFGIEVPDDTHGCLQDIHWSMGGFGYFPTYTLGNLHSAQLYAAAEKTLGHRIHLLQDGCYTPLLDWLRSNVHQHGRRHEPATLIREATGQDIQASFHGEYLKKRLEAIGV
ncbi:carboxypeptidase M32 [bacterium]|nr:carboxypeptidase M32 [bacterium]